MRERCDERLIGYRLIRLFDYPNAAPPYQLLDAINEESICRDHDAVGFEHSTELSRFFEVKQ